MKPSAARPMKNSLVRTLNALRRGGWYPSWEIFDNHCKRVSELINDYHFVIDTRPVPGEKWLEYHLVSEPPATEDRVHPTLAGANQAFVDETEKYLNYLAEIKRNAKATINPVVKLAVLETGGEQGCLFI